MLKEARYLYRRKTTEYFIKRDFDELVWQLDAADNNKRVIGNLNTKQPAVISGFTITHYFPNEFTVDYTSHFFNGQRLTKSHLDGLIEKISDTDIKLTLKQVPAFEIVYLLLPLLMLACIVNFIKNNHLQVTSLLLFLSIFCIAYINRRILTSLEKICVEYIRSGNECTI